MKKRYLILLLLFIAGTILCTWKWNTWFGNPPEAEYTVPGEPSRIVMTPGEDATTIRRITWLSDSIAAEGWVELACGSTGDTTRFPANVNVIRSRSGVGAFYQRELTGLKPGQSYAFRVSSNSKDSRWFHFSMPSTDAPFSFLYVGDIQDLPDGDSGQFFRDLGHQYPDVALWAFGGDVIERPTDAYWNHWYQSMDSIIPEKPLLAATGNHEYMKGLIKTLDTRWTSTFSFPENGPKDFEGRSYSVNYGDICFIVIDTDGIQGPASLYRHRQWLKNQLAATSRKWKIVMMHHPVYSVRKGRNNYYVRWTFKPLFEKYGVDLVLQGHDHGYSRITTKGDEGQKNCPVYVVSSASRKCYQIGFDPRHDRLGSDLQFYQYITVHKDSLHYQSFTREHQLYDDLLITDSNGITTVTDQAVELPESLSLPESYRKKTDLKEYEAEVQKRAELKTQQH